VALPDRVKVAGKVYVLCAAMIHTHNEDGTPKLIGILDRHKPVELAGGEEFLTLYVPLTMTLPTKPPDGI
jgi:hypothetical protein